MMNFNNQDRDWHVILSGAKNLTHRAEILRSAQNDMADPGRQHSRQSLER